jgi:uncharacterized protein YacL
MTIDRRLITTSIATVEAQLRTVPPFLVAALCAIAMAYLSYRMKQRLVPVLISTLLMVMGYAIAIGTKEPHARYDCCSWSTVWF